MLSRALVNFDVCLAYLVADSLCADRSVKEGRCPFAPYKKISYRDNPALLKKLSEINFILSYHKVLDDVMDDNSRKAKAAERLMRAGYKRVAGRNPQAAQAVSAGMEVIHKMETDGRRLPVRESAGPFGALLKSAMENCLEDPLDSEVFALLCNYLGMWIYVTDACMDLESDARQGRYNPITAGIKGEADQILMQRREEITEFLMSCKQSMQQLLELLCGAKNQELAQLLFEYIAPQEVIQMLQ